MIFFPCSVCDDVYVEKLMLIRHLRTHIGLKVFKCPCSAQFDKLDRLTRHFRACRTVNKNSESEVSEEQDGGKSAGENQDNAEHFGEPVADESTDSDTEESSVRSNHLDDSFLNLLLKLLSDSVLSRKKAVNFIQELNCFAKNLLQNVESKIKPFVQPEKLGNFSDAFKSYESQFSLNSEHKIQAYLRSNGLFQDPEEDIIENPLVPITQHGERILGHKKCKVIMPCLKFTLKQYFERDNLLKLILNYMDELRHDNSGIIRNYIQAQAWKEKISKLDPAKIYIPMFLYNDDFEPDNALGAHKGKNSQCAFYFSCPVLPCRIRSKLTSLIPVMFINSKLKKSKS